MFGYVPCLYVVSNFVLRDNLSYVWERVTSQVELFLTMLDWSVEVVCVLLMSSCVLVDACSFWSWFYLALNFRPLVVCICLHLFSQVLFRFRFHARGAVAVPPQTSTI